jgi:hypothetical protein
MALARLVYVLIDWCVSQQAAPRNDDTGAFLAVLSAVVFGSKVASCKSAPKSLSTHGWCAEGCWRAERVVVG